MRIVGGRFKGRNLVAPRSGATRPTSDRVRESVFNILQHGSRAENLDGKHVIDLFAGTGALGIEALSRGAAFALFIEQSADARAVIQSNIEALALQGITKLFRRDAAKLGPMGRGKRFSLAFLDPPYGRGLAEQALSGLAAGGWLSPGATVVIEESTKAALQLPPAFEEWDRRTYSDTQVIITTFTDRQSA